VAEPERTALLLELLQVELQARRPADAGQAAAELEALAGRALDQGDPDHARLGFHMLAYLRWEEGDLADAQRHMDQAERVGRAADGREHVVALAEASRCLVLLERDLPRAEALALEARALSSRVGHSPPAVADAQGMLRQHQGRFDGAAELYEEARLAARRAADALGEFQALEHLVVLNQERGAWTEARRLAAELRALGDKLREGSEAPFARALLALSGHALGEAGDSLALDEALEDLRVADAKLRLAYTLTRAARVDLAQGNPGRARARADEAHRAAAALGRPTETLLAAATLVRTCRALGENEEAARVTDALRGGTFGGASLPARREREAVLREEAGAESGPEDGGREEGRP
jgi:hypothetical protein